MAAKQLKEQNLDRLRYILFDKGVATKAELAHLSNLSTVTVNSLVNILSEKNEILYNRHVFLEKGRPASQYQFNYDLHHYLLISIQYNDTKELEMLAIVSNMKGEQKFRKEIPFKESTIQTFLDNLHSLLDLPYKISGISISIPGQEINGEVKVSWENKLDGWRIADEIKKQYDIPVKIDNDANLATVGFCQRHTLPVEDIVIGLIFRDYTKPGSCIFINESIVYGKNRLAGEIKYLPDIYHMHSEHDDSFEIAVQHVIKVICTFNSMIAPHYIILYMNNLDEEFFRESLQKNKLFGVQPSKPVILIGQSFEEDIAKGLLWLMINDYTFFKHRY
ncbi:ROK family protein [Bacillus sp. 28A-2]|uniref:ROK family protein n=1 Tax=Bacillus sp. 28A-2 TaxID=2772252 RepID=UPI00168D7284|nr:ROK family protein [Bacillus sp. 28A-2]MBD3861617.1 ROK family protein [Bacillus sp. 28A-2]